MAVKRPPEERTALLEESIFRHVQRGWRVESQGKFYANLVFGDRVNHILHLLLTIVTGGLWAIVWIIVAWTGGENRKTITVDEYDQQQRQRRQLAETVQGLQRVQEDGEKHREFPADMLRRSRKW